MRQIKPSELSDNQLNHILDNGSSALERYGLELVVEDTGPGKFEGNPNPGLAEAVYERSLDTSWFDDETGTVEWYYHVGLLGRFLLYENDQGFVTLQEFDTVNIARKSFDKFADEYEKWDEGDDE